ncbi:MAG: hybrid sensor histidine kinase/response regulator [Anaerolineae bacterium]|nr:hybrid sensor histidine kinase/response regulator [Anaerolineae bacterium]
MTPQLQISRQAKILMVDDVPSNLIALSDMMTTFGYGVEKARDGRSTLEAVKANPPDLILLDINMPDMNGYEVCEKLKADPATRDIPVIFISALSETENIVRGFEIGGVDYITKPFQYREVVARVQNQLMLVYQRRQIEALRAQDRQYFESLNRMKDQFIRMATHDLRNPLNVILGYTHVLDRLEVAESDKPLLNQSVENIRDSVDKMRTLVTDMLDLAQLETGSHLSLSAVVLNDFLQKCLTSFHVLASQEQIELVYEAPPGDACITIDESYMARVVDNLVANAIKYSPPKSKVTVRAWIKGGCTSIEVQDTGIGIPKADLPHLFDAFYRVQNAGSEQVEGSGLGLSIVKTIVEQHGGQITVQSKTGQGSTFRVVLPMNDTI